MAVLQIMAEPRGLRLMRLRTIDAPPLMTVTLGCKPQKSETLLNDQGQWFHLFSERIVNIIFFPDWRIQHKLQDALQFARM